MMYGTLLLAVQLVLIIFNYGNARLIDFQASDIFLKSDECEGLSYCHTGELNDPILGVFKQGPDTPWCHQGSIPESTDKIQPKFYVYSQTKDSQSAQEIIYDSMQNSIRNLSLNTNNDLWIIIHGFECEWPKPWMFPMKDALFAKGHSVILVRWTGNGKTGGSCAPAYWTATANTRVMGAVVAYLVNSLIDNKEINGSPNPKAHLSNITLVGFSLGAHVAGFAGARLPGLPRIIALDPAGPFYTNCGIETRLNHTDAKFVQAIHCNGMKDIGFGSTEAMGDLDFYANGGLAQPGCYDGGSTEKNNPGRFRSYSISCSHSRCHDLFTSTILNEGKCNFRASPCPDISKWDSGDCLKCDPKVGCIKPGYELGKTSEYSGKWAFGTTDIAKPLQALCGNTFKLILTPGSSFRHGTLYAQLDGENFTNSSNTELASDEFDQNKILTHTIMGSAGGKTPSHVTITLDYGDDIFYYWTTFLVNKVQIIRGSDNESFETTEPVLLHYHYNSAKLPLKDMHKKQPL